MIWLFSFLFNFSLAANLPMEIPSQYVQQNQHNAFYLFNVNGESITTECYLTEPMEYSKCRMIFDDYKNKRHVYEVPFLKLYDIQKPLIQDLKALQKEWLQRYPLDDWSSYFSLFRADTHEALAQLIDEIENESLPFRMFITKANPGRRDTPYMYDTDLTQKVWDIFKTYLDFRSEQQMQN